MATIACWALHGNINDAISYVLDVKNDGAKTENMYYDCTSGNAYTAGYQWKINNDNENKTNNQIVGFHFRQSFEPNSISKEEAYEISKKWIDEILKGEYDYVITLHTDKKHIHSHIIVNPKNKKTGKQLTLFYKRDIPKFKVISDAICKENGLRTLDAPEGAGKSYYQWMMENKGDSLKTIISKSLDNLVNRVSTYDELKGYLKILGFEVEDGIDNAQTESFTFTGDIKLVLDKEDTHMNVRLPYSSYFIKISNENIVWKKENKTFQVTYDLGKPVKIYDKSGKHIKTINAEELELNWEKKSRSISRQGLRIKVPSSNKFIRCKCIEKNEEGMGYSLDEILERIENNGRLSCDPEIKEVLNNFKDKDMSKIKENFFDDAHIKEKWINTNYYKKTKKERYIAWRTKQLQEKINSIDHNLEISIYKRNYAIIQDDLKSLKQEYRKLNDDIRDQESTLQDIQIKKMENIIEITDNELEEYVADNITPLYKTKKQIAEKIKELEKMIKEVERGKDYKPLEH